MRKSWKSERGSFSDKPLDERHYGIAQQFKDIHTVGRDILEKTGDSVNKWISEMVKRYGENVRPYLAAVWHYIKEPAPIWYSQAERAITSKMPNAASTEQVKAILALIPPAA